MAMHGYEQVMKMLGVGDDGSRYRRMGGKKPMTTEEFKEITRVIWSINCGDAYIMVDGVRKEIESIHYEGNNIVVEAST